LFIVITSTPLSADALKENPEQAAAARPVDPLNPALAR
jgi:hypothetical protein